MKHKIIPTVPATQSEARPRPYWAAPCGCGHRSCTSWHVWTLAAEHGVSFTEQQARTVAELLNKLEAV